MIDLLPPLHGSPPITQHFGENPAAYSRFGQAGHNGIDYAVPLHTPVYAAAPGQVVFIGTDPAGYGIHIVLHHILPDDTTLKTLYAHLSQPLVEIGNCVAADQLIARSGSSGNSTGPHLHWELRLPLPMPGYPQGAVDPLLYVAPTSGTPALYPVNTALYPGHVIVVVDQLNLRLAPTLDAAILRGSVRLGDVLETVGPTVAADGITWQPIKAFVAAGNQAEVYLEKAPE